MPVRFPASFHVDSSELGREISFRPVSLGLDLMRLSQWMHQPHVVPFWNLDMPLEKYAAFLRKALADQHQSLYIGSLDGVPMSYWEVYRVQDDVLGQYYPAHPADQGVHLLIGPPSFLGKGYALPLLRAIVTRLFQNADTEKVVAEPDLRNKKMIHVFEKCGFQPQQEIDLPDKRALLMFCRRR